MNTKAFLQITDLLPEAMFIVDEKGQILVCNKAATTLLKINCQEAVDIPISDFLAESPEKIDYCIKYWLQSSDLSPCELAWRTSYGEIISCSSFGALFEAKSANILAKILLRCQPNIKITPSVIDPEQFKDITKQENDLSVNILSSLPGVYYMYDENGHFLRWNRQFEIVTEYSDKEMQHLHPLDLFTGDDKNLLKERIETVFRDGRGEVEADFVSKSGKRTPYYFNGVRAEINGQICLLGMGIDISSRKQTEATLSVSEGRYRTLFEYAPDGIVIADHKSYYIDANPSICQMLGYTRDEFIGLHASDIVAEAELQNIEPALDSINARSDYHREWKFKRKDGSVFIAEVIATKMPDGNIVAMIRDITESKQASIEREKRYRAETADRIKSAFLATMSHELRTPLNSIIGFTGIILQGLAGPLNPEQRKQLEMVRVSARHLLALINDVLDISKIESGQLEVASQPFDLKQSITKVITIVTPMAEKKGLKICVELATELGQITSDERRFEQVLLNLLSNAIKFTECGGVTLRAEIIADFTLAGATSGQPCICLKVSDTGVGITAEDLETLFQPFHQINSGLSRNYEGTGLGLAICRRLMELMGGEIKAESVWKKGSTFSFALPLKVGSKS